VAAVDGNLVLAGVNITGFYSSNQSIVFNQWKSHNHVLPKSGTYSNFFDLYISGCLLCASNHRWNQLTS
jgi:hypothetical protein